MSKSLANISLPAEETALVSATEQRKQSHVELCLNADVDFVITNGFERYRYAHNAAPELNFSDIDLSTTFLGRRISYPFMISSMTGGYAGATFVNQLLAEACQELGIPFGVGSMRQALENTTQRESFSVVRRAAPTIQIFANIGAAEVAAGLSPAQYRLLIDLIQADGLIVHLNPAQELFQPEGNTNFKGLLRELKILTTELSLPVIVKEVGCGISAPVAERLLEAGARVIDVAGAGGTNWQKVEALRHEHKFGNDARFSPSALAELMSWGIPTAQCLEDVSSLRTRYPEMELISSGGITNGIEIAKSLSLGATIAASAKPMIQALLVNNGGKDAVKSRIQTMMNDLRAAMFLVGAGTIDTLKEIKLISEKKYG